MRRIAQFAVTALTVIAAPLGAQSSYFKAPVFVFQPGGVTVNAISAPDGLDRTTAFNARFATIVPTASPYFSTVFGAQVATGGHAGTPGIFYGGIIPIRLASSMSSGFIDFSIDPLGVTGFGGTGGTNFYLEGAFVFQVGKKMMSTMGQTWSGTGVYFLIDQQISGPLPRDENNDKDRWRPVLLYGLSIPFGFGK